MTITPLTVLKILIWQKNMICQLFKLLMEKEISRLRLENLPEKTRGSRDEIVKFCKEKGLVERIDENYKHKLSVCYRCDTPVELLVSKQWFISVSKKFIWKNRYKT